MEPIDEAVVGLHGIRADRTFIASIADTLLTGSPPIRVEVFDPAPTQMNSFADALQTAQSLVELPGLVGVVGHRDSRSTLVVGPIYRDARVPLVVPNATARAIAELGPAVFRLVPDDVAQGAVLARAAARGLRASGVSVFHVADEFGTGIRDGVLPALEAEGVTVLDARAYGLTRNRCPDDFLPFVEASLLRGTPDVVILAGRNPDTACLGTLLAERVPDVRFLVADGVDPDDRFLTQAAAMVDRAWFATFASADENPALRAFQERYERVTGVHVDRGTALRIDGVRLLVQAIRDVGPDPERVTAWLHDLGVGRPPFQGVTGPISFEAGRPLTMVIVDAEGHPVPREGW